MKPKNERKIGERMCDKKMKKRQNNKKRQSYKRDRMTLREQNPKDVFTLLELGRKKIDTLYSRRVYPSIRPSHYMAYTPS